METGTAAQVEERSPQVETAAGKDTIRGQRLLQEIEEAAQAYQAVFAQIAALEIPDPQDEVASN
jgi:hypothetical protein